MVDAVSNSVQSQIINSTPKKVDSQRSDDKDKKTATDNRTARTQQASQPDQVQKTDDTKKTKTASGNDNDRDDRSTSSRPHRGSQVNILA